MRPGKTTLVMAGSREAHALTKALMARGRRVIASLPEPERMFGPLPVPTRVGRFTAAHSLENWLQENEVSIVIDASHSFDSDISEQISGYCSAQSLRYLRLLRPPWQAAAQDIWHDVSSVRQAASAVPQEAVVFANTGWQTLPDYADFAGQKLFLRQTHAPSQQPPFPFVEFVEGSPPFSQFQEQALFARLGITHLLCRNVGGAASMSKLLAARAMQIPVLMVARPPTPDHPAVETVAEALEWEAHA